MCLYRYTITVEYTKLGLLFFGFFWGQKDTDLKRIWSDEFDIFRLFSMVKLCVYCCSCLDNSIFQKFRQKKAFVENSKGSREEIALRWHQTAGILQITKPSPPASIFYAMLTSLFVFEWIFLSFCLANSMFSCSPTSLQLPLWFIT